MELPKELLFVVFEKIPVTIIRLTCKNLCGVFDHVFISKMHYISYKDKEEFFNDGNTVVFNRGSHYHVYDKKELIYKKEGLCCLDDNIFECNIDLISQYHILKKRNYPNLSKDYAKNYIKNELARYRVGIYGTDVGIGTLNYFFSLWLVGIDLKYGNDITSFNYNQTRAKLAYKTLEQYIDNL